MPRLQEDSEEIAIDEYITCDLFCKHIVKYKQGKFKLETFRSSFHYEYSTEWNPYLTTLWWLQQAFTLDNLYNEHFPSNPVFQDKRKQTNQIHVNWGQVFPYPVSCSPFDVNICNTDMREPVVYLGKPHASILRTRLLQTADIFVV